MSLDANFVARFAATPSPTTVNAAVAAHTSIRDLLGDTRYATVLQGSYKNDTALSDMNDVDIVVVDRGLTSRIHASSTSTGEGVSWNEIFARVERSLQASSHYAGKWKREDKCIRVNLAMRVDVVPAVRVSDAATDPIAIYSFSKGQEKLNWPRGHYDGGAAKSGRTSGNYKQTVRLFKRWARCWFPGTKVAPSYYIECAIHTLPDVEFTGDLAATFDVLGRRLVAMSYASTKIPRIAGEGNLLTHDEWGPTGFARFQTQLAASLRHVQIARSASDPSAARRSWISAFNGYTG